MTKRLHVYTLLMFVCCTLCEGQTSYYPTDTNKVITSHGPLGIARNIKQDKKGNIWIAAFSGVYRYDGKSFTNITSKLSSTRFFDVLEDRKGNFCFSSIGSGVYYYDPSESSGKAFKHFTTKDGLVGNEVPHIYEDKSGSIWFGTITGASRWDGKSFQNFKPNEGLSDVNPDDNDINSIIEDKKGQFWFATRGNTFIYDGKKFTVLTHDGESFTNVRTIMEDKKGNIWLAGSNGLWRYDGKTFTNFTKNFTGYVYEDKKGNIWTSSQPDYNGSNRWALLRYEAKTLSDPKPTVTDIMADYEDYKGMLFGILEALDGSIWFGSLAGVHRYDPPASLRAGKNIITSFKDK